jgi:hypothetical protein
LLGVPGYPVSAIVIARDLAGFGEISGSAAPVYPNVHVIVPKKIASPWPRRVYSRHSGPSWRSWSPWPLARGAGVITTMVRRRIDAHSCLVEGLNAGDEAVVELPPDRRYRKHDS